MWGRKFLPGGEILVLLRIFVFVVFVANRSALAKESVVYSVGSGYGQGLQGDGVVFEVGL
jgi:Na+-transporting NADH:ubiquinone oxidoreductase subunit NqrE